AGALVTATPVSNISYTVSGTDAGSCTGRATISIGVYPSPTIFVSPGITICSGNSASLSASGAISYSWTPATTPSNAATVTASPNSTTTYTVTGTDNNNCSSAATVKVSITNGSIVTTSPDVTIIQGSSTVISASGGGTYFWTPSTDLSCNTCQDPA